MTLLFIAFYLLFLKTSQSRDSIRKHKHSYIYSYLLNEEINDYVPILGRQIIKYVSDGLPVGIYLNPKTGNIFGRPQQAGTKTIKIYGYTMREVFTEYIIIKGIKLFFPS